MATGTLVLDTDYATDGTILAQLSVIYDTARKDLTSVTIINNSPYIYQLDVQDQQSGQNYTFRVAAFSGTISSSVPKGVVPVAQDPTTGGWGIVNWTFEFGPTS